jgi:hypothetical protein
MARTVEKTLFQFDELDDSAKETAREWFRSCYEGVDVDDDDFQNVAGILGIEFATRSIPLVNGSTRQEPTIYYSGFWSQGDGACFEGSYSYKSGAAKEIRKYAPLDKELHRIADELQQTQRRNFYKLTATCTHRGRYYHSGCMSVDVEDSRDSWREFPEADADSITQCLRDFADWIYSQLQAEYEYQNSDEIVDDSIRANEYEFEHSGDIA